MYLLDAYIPEHIYIVEEVEKLLNKFTKNIYVVTISFTLCAIFRRQVIKYKTVQIFKKAVEYFLHRMILTNRAIN